MILLLAFAMVPTLAPVARGQDIDWTRQFGTASSDAAYGISVDATGVYVAGGTGGSLEGVGAGSTDAYVRKYTVAGAVVWTRQFGTSASDEALGVVASSDGVYAAGITAGSLGGTSAGLNDAFLRKYDSSGVVLWTVQFGFGGGDWAAGVASDASGVYVAGVVSGTFPGETSAGVTDCYIRKYDHSGVLNWTDQFGTGDFDGASAIAADASGIYLTGNFGGSGSGVSAFLRKYNSTGVLGWSVTFTSGDQTIGKGVAIGPSGLFVAGSTRGSFPGFSNAGGPEDAFVRKYDTAGTEAWTRQFGTTSVDSANGGSVDASGVYFAGSTGGTLPDQTSSGGPDGFVRKYDAAGTEMWTRQFGSASDDSGSGISVDASGVYVAGSTAGTLPGQTSSGGYDAFVIKLSLGVNTTTDTVVHLEPGHTVVTASPIPLGSTVHDNATVSSSSSGPTITGTVTYNFWTNGGCTGTPASSDTVSVGSESPSKGPLAASSYSFNATYSGDANYDASSSACEPFSVSTANTVTTTEVHDASHADITGSSVPLGTVVHDNATVSGQVDGFTITDTEAWTRQFGSSAVDAALGISVGASGVYVAGHADGTLPGQTSAGGRDAFVRKYNAAGTELWTRQFGTSADDLASGVFADASGVYVAGNTHGTLPGQTSAGSSDVFVRKYDAAGNELWTRQFGTSSYDDAASNEGISGDASGVYVAGRTEGTLPGQTSAGSSDVFVRKYNAAGAELWTRQFGTSAYDVARGPSADTSGVYVAGSTSGAFPSQTNLGSFDVFVRKYDAAGTEAWTRQFGTSADDQAHGVSADLSAVYVTGFTSGTLPGQTSAGADDAFVRKYDAAGTEAWTRQFGTAGADYANGASSDASGVYVAGNTYGTLPGQTSAGSSDVFVRKYDAAGTEAWTRQFGTSVADDAAGPSVDASAVYVAGRTGGTLPGQTSSGGTDAFVRKYDTAGTISYNFWTNGNCGGTPTSLETVGVGTESTAQTLGAGSYSYNATYSGDANHNLSFSACEPFEIEKADTTIVTEIHNSTHAVVSVVILGTAVHDNASVSGAVAPFAITGTVTYNFWTNSNCDGTPPSSETVGLGTESSAQTLAAGSYSFNATYSGNSNYKPSFSACEPFSVTTADTATTTQVHDASHADITGSSVPLGTVVHDNATVSGAVAPFAITGTITYNFWTNGNCGGTPTSSETVVLGTESSAQTLGAGSYSYNATYSGDATYNASFSACEPFSVTTANTVTTTEVHDASHAVVTSVPFASTVHDNATVSGTVAPSPITGTVTYNFWTNGGCAGTPFSSNTVSVGSESPSKGPLGAGSYSFNATYSGDANYNASFSACEPFTVEQAGTAVVTQVHGAAHTDITGSSVPLGTVVHDNATVSGTVAPFAITGTITYNFWTNGNCGGTPTSTEGPLSLGTESTAQTLGAGSYSYNATYSGDVNYNASFGACEPFTIKKSATTIVTEIHNATHAVVTVVVQGTAVHDNATVSGAVAPFPITGTVRYNFRTNVNCAGPFTSETVPVGAESTPQLLAPGSYSYNATYSGDANYNPSFSACEPLRVVPESKVTNTEFCDFGGQFKLIYIQNNTGSTYRLVASNPGQFYDNVFFAGTSGAPVSLQIKIPFPFVTQGAKPIQVHSSVGFTTVGTQTCFQLTDDITSAFSVEVRNPAGTTSGGTTSSGNPSILLGSYSPQNLGSQVFVWVNGSVPSTGFLWVTVHLEYGLKGKEFTQSTSCSMPPCGVTTIGSQTITVQNNQPYTFGVMGDVSDTQTVTSINIFKKDPGIAGVVTDLFGTPRVGVKVEIYDAKGDLKKTVYTDSDGFYSYLFTYKGKPTTFTIKLPDYGVEKTVTIRSNKLVIVNFAV